MLRLAADPRPQSPPARRAIYPVVLGAIVLGSAACAQDAPQTQPDAGPEITWHRDVRPLVAQHCEGCHSEGQVAPFTFNDWSTVEALAPSLVASVQDGSMPPFAFDPDCQQIIGDPRPDDAAKAVFAAWRDAGFPQGDPADYQAPETSRAAALPEFDVQVLPSESFELDFRRIDDYRCMVSDAVFEEDTWVTGLDAILDNSELVHHLILYSVPGDQAEALRELDAADEAPGIACYDGYGFWMLPGLSDVHFWVPGAETWYQDPQSAERMGGMLIEAGSILIIEGHFNSLATESDTVSDRSGFGLWTLEPGQTPDDVLWWSEVSTYSLDIPAGATDHTEEGTLSINRDVDLVAVSPHMHLLGTKLTSNLTRPDGSGACIAQVDPYDFDWQRAYMLAEPISLERGDVLDVTCTYDNSAENQPVIDGQQREPRDVSYGDRTIDEMCINGLLLSTPYTGDAE